MNDVTARTSRGKAQKAQGKRPESRRLSLYGLSIEDALRAAAKTGRPEPCESTRTNRQRKKKTNDGGNQP
jgi:hypothetical protein